VKSTTDRCHELKYILDVTKKKKKLGDSNPLVIKIFFFFFFFFFFFLVINPYNHAPRSLFSFFIFSIYNVKMGGFY
jgi:hypothetical protein